MPDDTTLGYESPPPDVPGFALVREVGRLAKRADADLTRTHDHGGTPAYMAPEQAVGMKFVGPPADVWSLGVVLYEALAGRRPFDGDTTSELFERIRRDEPPAPRTLNPQVPPDLETVCLKCLEKEPGRRYPTARELAADLRAWLDGRPIAARRATRAERAVLWVRRNRTLAAAAALAVTAAVLLLAAAGASYLWRDAAESRDRLTDEQGRTEAARVRAEDAEAVARAAQETLAREEYARSTYAAWLDYGNRDLARGRALLAGCRPDLRGWEWHHLHRLCHQDVLTLRGHQSWVSAVAYSPDGARLVTAGGDKVADVWDADTGAVVFALRGHDDRLSSVAFSADGARIATTCGDETVRIWDAKTGGVKRVIRGRAARGVAFHPDRSRVAAAGYDHAVHLWDADTGDAVGRLEGHTHAVADVAYNRDGTRLVSASLDKTAKVWDAAAGRAV